MVARFKADGPLDPSLGGTGRVQFGPKDRDDVPAAVLVQPDRKIVIAQNSGTALRRITVMRLTEAGALDTSFAGDGTATPEFLGESFTAGAALQPDGKILVAGMLGPESDFVAARLDTDGAPDLSFGTDGKTQIAFEDIALAVRGGAPARRQARDRRRHGRAEPHRDPDRARAGAARPAARAAGPRAAARHG